MEIAARLLLLVVAVGPALLLLTLFRGRDDFATDADAVWGAFAVGATSGFLVLPLELVIQALLPEANSALTHGATRAFLVAALPEESVKLVVLSLFLARHAGARAPHDVVVLAVAVSLGFAALENLFYLQGGDAWGLVAVSRGVTAVPGHACFGALMGGLLALARLGGPARLLRAAAWATPVLAHGLYDTPLMILEKVAAGDPSPDLSLVLALVLGFGLVLVDLLAIVLWLATRVRAGERLAGLSAPPCPRPGRLLAWWLARPQLRALAWMLGGMAVFLPGVVLVLLGIAEGPRPGDAGGLLPQPAILGLFSLLTLAYGGLFLLHGNDLRRRRLTAGTDGPRGSAPPPPSSSAG